MLDDRRLLAFALGSFHAALLTFILIATLYLTSDLGALLDRLNTALGLAVFGALWATSVYCAHRGILDAPLTPGDQTATAAVLSNAVTWGAWNGVLFFWCLLITLLAVVAGEGLASAAGLVVSAIVAFGVGTIFAMFIGAFLGVLAALLDLALLRAARAAVGMRA